MECMRQYISELLDFIADMHTLTKLKVSLLCVSLQFGHVSRVEFFFFILIFSSLQICSSEPYEGLLSATARGHFWGQPESGLGTSCSHGDQ